MKQFAFRSEKFLPEAADFLSQKELFSPDHFVSEIRLKHFRNPDS